MKKLPTTPSRRAVKLELKRETLAVLSEDNLRAVVGGTSNNSACWPCDETRVDGGG
jgi:hypothetical protein